MSRGPAARLVDSVMEATIAPSFTRLGIAARRRLEDWTPLDDYDASGRRIVVTGATSGLGRETATQLVELGADVVIVARNEAKADDVAAAIDPSGERVAVVVADMGELDDVRRASKEIAAGGPVHALVHNAGALSKVRQETSAGTEATVASQVVGPFLMTSLLLDELEATGGRVITVTSGGMYAAPLSVGRLEMAEDDYDGTDQYARAKRAQVTLNEMWEEREGHRGISFHTVHPGWADTPGVEESLPTFRKIVGRALRTPAEGADTIVWLCVEDAVDDESGSLWHDRGVRAIHRLPTTRRSDTPERRAVLWEHVAHLAEG